jgi:Putative addiction module component
MAQMTPKVSRLLEQALSLSVEEQEALADSLISSLGGKVDEGVRAAWDDEIKKRITDAGFGQGKNRSLVRSSQSQLGEAASCH